MHPAALRITPSILAQKKISSCVQENAPASVSKAHSQQGVVRLEYLDGFRSVMALMVLLWHACSAAQNAPAWLKLFSSGFWHVSAFFVLSGFILYLPSAGRERIETSRPFGEYVRRRVWRLAPPYYVAIILSFLVPFVLSKLSIISPEWSSPQQVASYLWHLTFLQTWSKEFWQMTNEGCWMLGYEWVLSLCFPFFIYVARKGGWAALMTLVVLLRITYPEPVGGLLQMPFHTVYTFCFVGGMMAARLARRQQGIFGLNKQQTAFCLLMTFASSVILAVLFAQMQIHSTMSGWLIGLSLASFLAALAYLPASLPVRLLSIRPLKKLSAFTYSLFLVNCPLLHCATWIARKLGLAGSQEFYLVILPSVPIIIALAYLFHLLFERPTTQAQQARKTEPVSVRVVRMPSRVAQQFHYLVWLVRSNHDRVAVGTAADPMR